MRALDVAVDVMATARLTRLITEDEIARPLREAASASSNELVAYLPTCPYCVSVWAGLAVASGIVPRPIRYGLALSEAALNVRRAIDALPVRW